VGGDGADAQARLRAQRVRHRGSITLLDVEGRERPVKVDLTYGELGGSWARQQQDMPTIERWWVDHRGAAWKPTPGGSA
jgi:hypothetical protein